MGIATHTSEDRINVLQGYACERAMANSMRSGTVDSLVGQVLRMGEPGVEVNTAALARMTGISRQTLHARLRTARAPE